MVFFLQCIVQQAARRWQSETDTVKPGCPSFILNIYHFLGTACFIYTRSPTTWYRKRFLIIIIIFNRATEVTQQSTRQALEFYVPVSSREARRRTLCSRSVKIWTEVPAVLKPLQLENVSTGLQDNFAGVPI